MLQEKCREWLEYLTASAREKSFSSDGKIEWSCLSIILELCKNGSSEVFFEAIKSYYYTLREFAVIFGTSSQFYTLHVQILLA